MRKSNRNTIAAHRQIDLCPSHQRPNLLLLERPRLIVIITYSIIHNTQNTAVFLVGVACTINENLQTAQYKNSRINMFLPVKLNVSRNSIANSLTHYLLTETQRALDNIRRSRGMYLCVSKVSVEFAVIDTNDKGCVIRHRVLLMRVQGQEERGTNTSAFYASRPVLNGVNRLLKSISDKEHNLGLITMIPTQDYISYIDFKR